MWRRCLLAALLLHSAAWAEARRGGPDASGTGSEAEPSDVVVFGRGEAKVGIAAAASEGTIAGFDLLVRPLLRVAELLEAVPGMVADDPFAGARLRRARSIRRVSSRSRSHNVGQ
jgi:hypothetical protein